jgi:hypothetical protein
MWGYILENMSQKMKPGCTNLRPYEKNEFRGTKDTTNIPLT